MPIRPLDVDDLPAVDALIRARAEDLGAEPIGERKVVALSRVPAGLVAEVDGVVQGVAPWVGGDPRTFEVVAVSDDLADELVEAMVATSRDRRLRAWSLRGRDDERLAAAGFRRERDLHEMFRPLPVEAPAGSELEFRGFLPGDEAVWLDLNNRAFAGHPEQGELTAEDLAARLARPWFRPEGLRFALHAGDAVGFCWTKVHEGGVGEIYAIAVDPEAKGRGWGASLVGEGLRHLTEVDGCASAKLFVDGGNRAAVGLYRSLGFEVVGTDRAWVREPQPKRI